MAGRQHLLRAALTSAQAGIVMRPLLEVLQHGVGLQSGAAANLAAGGCRGSAAGCLQESRLLKIRAVGVEASEYASAAALGV